MTAHELLLRMAGRIPDQLLTRAWRELAGGDAGAAIALLTDSLTQAPIPLTADELATIRLLADDSGVLPGLEPAAALPELPFGFSQFDDDGNTGQDELDEAVIATVRQHDGVGVTGVWRSWRYWLPDDDEGIALRLEGAAGADLAADDEAAWQGSYRVYIVQVEDPGAIGALVGGLLAAVSDSGIEIITRDAEPPPYQRAALAESIMLWTALTEPEFVVARVFDSADPVTGPAFVPDHPVIDDPASRGQLLSYLRGGIPVLTTTATLPDLFDPAAGSVVPTSFRTDGRWIWTDTVVYYLNRHRLAPDAELTRHIETQLSRGRLVPHTDLDTAIRAADFLLYPPASAASTAGSPGD